MTPPKSSMGLATTCYLTARRPADTYEFLEYSAALGAGGIQASLRSLEPEYVKRLRSRAEQLGMYLEVMSGLGGDLEARAAAAREAGALCLRAACLSGRRYETFDSLEAWKKFVADSEASMERAARVAEKARIPIAIENHKDWTAEEMAAYMKRLSSEWFGVCVDTGNNIALLDDAYDLVERLAPYAVSTHIKDMALAPAPDGFLLSEVAFGEGQLDLKRIIGTIQKARPKTRMTMETITRDPLRVPCLGAKYWITMRDRKAVELARTLAMASRYGQALPVVKGMDRGALLRHEEDNVKKSLYYARTALGLTA
ncbi:MAG: TIM barrel protein [Bryobacteraceae bacterium]|nr:TIM barrel protein [Bryobacteraceae bacterium]